MAGSGVRGDDEGWSGNDRERAEAGLGALRDGSWWQAVEAQLPVLVQRGAMLADADKAVFLWINGLAGRAPAVDFVMAWVASDYLAHL